MLQESSTISGAQIIFWLLGGGGLVALTGFLTFLAARFDERRRRKKEENEKALHNTIEGKKLEFENLIKSSEFTSQEYIKIIKFLNDDKAEKEKEILELSLFARSAKETIGQLQTKVFDLELTSRRQSSELEDSRKREDDCTRRLKELETQVLKLKKK